MSLRAAATASDVGCWDDRRVSPQEQYDRAMDSCRHQSRSDLGAHSITCTAGAYARSLRAIRRAAIYDGKCIVEHIAGGTPGRPTQCDASEFPARNRLVDSARCVGSLECRQRVLEYNFGFSMTAEFAQCRTQCELVVGNGAVSSRQDAASDLVCGLQMRQRLFRFRRAQLQ